jgi:hypothetical protein
MGNRFLKTWRKEMTLKDYTRFIAKFARFARFESGSSNRKGKKFAKLREVINQDLRALLGKEGVGNFEKRFEEKLYFYFPERVLFTLSNSFTVDGSECRTDPKRYYHELFICEAADWPDDFLSFLAEICEPLLIKSGKEKRAGVPA